MSELRVNAVTDETGGNTATINSMTPTAQSLQGFRNRILNGGMVLDQRNAGASITPANGQYGLDRWRNGASAASKFSVQQNAGSVTPPQGFVNYLGATSLSAYSVGAGEAFLVQQYVEGYNTADLAWGTASASAVTLSFWVRSSLTGTFGGSLQNSDRSRCFPFSYAVTAANTWEQKTITVPGDTSGTWLTTSGIGIQVNFSIGSGTSVSGTAGAWSGSTLFSATGAVSVVGTSGATFRITGVQLEAGSVATPFERRPIGTELALCQRYAVQLADGTNQVIATGQCFSISAGGGVVRFPVEMRAAPTITASSSFHFGLTGATGSTLSMAGTNFVFASTRSFLCEFTGRSGGGLTAGDATTIFATDSAARLLASAEL